MEDGREEAQFRGLKRRVHGAARVVDQQGSRPTLHCIQFRPPSDTWCNSLRLEMWIAAAGRGRVSTLPG